MRLPKGHPNYQAVGGDGEQVCKGELIRSRTVTGICNDIRNPLMGSTGQLFARNVEFDTTFPELGRNELTKNRHGDRLSLLKPDPQLIGRKLFTRKQSCSNPTSVRTPGRRYAMTARPNPRLRSCLHHCCVPASNAPACYDNSAHTLMRSWRNKLNKQKAGDRSFPKYLPLKSNHLEDFRIKIT